jgi:hypothetical protein
MAIDLVKWRRRLIYVHGDAILLTWLPKYLKFQRNLENPLRLQEKKLLAILQANKDTAFGKKYGFGEIQTIRQFQDRVPINDYESMKPYINRMIQGEKNVLTYQEPFFFSTTSGTTGEPKYIPITPDFEKEYNDRLWLFTFLRTYPCSGYFNSILAIVSQPSDEVTPGGIPCGSHSHRTYCRQSRLIRAIYALPREVFAIDDWYARYYAILRLSLEKPVRIMFATHPNSLLTLAQKADEVKDWLIRDVEQGTLEPSLPIPLALRRSLERHLWPNPRRAARLRRSLIASGGKLLPAAVWPTLQAVVCWVDGSARFYQSQLAEIYRLPIHNLGYLATEGRGSIPVTGDGTDVLAIHLHFFEFIPVDEITKKQYSVLTCDQLEAGKYYYIIFTASNGLYRYFINDIIYVSGFYKKTPVISFAFKGGNVSSLTGEKIYETHVENAMARAQRRIGATIVDYTAIPCLATPPFYRVAVEFAGPEQQGLEENLARELDCQLIKENISYRRMREARILAELVVTALPPGTFAEFIKFRIDAEGAPYSQIKISHLNPGRSFLKFLENHSLTGDKGNR